jgi:3-oxoadipate enol-lactonase
VLVGGLDLDTVHDAAGRVVAGIAGARRVDWPDAGHLPSLEHPAAFAELILRWVEDTPATAG